MTEPDVPTRLYHITRIENVDSILEEGLTCGWGNYASSTIENAARFVAFRAMTNPEQKWAAIEIVDADELGFELGGDHDPSFFGTDDSWMTMQPVPPFYLQNVYEVTFGPQEVE